MLYISRRIVRCKLNFAGNELFRGDCLRYIHHANSSVTDSCATSVWAKVAPKPYTRISAGQKAKSIDVQSSTTYPKLKPVISTNTVQHPVLLEEITTTTTSTSSEKYDNYWETTLQSLSSRGITEVVEIIIDSSKRYKHTRDLNASMWKDCSRVSSICCRLTELKDEPVHEREVTFCINALQYVPNAEAGRALLVADADALREYLTVICDLLNRCDAMSVTSVSSSIYGLKSVCPIKYPLLLEVVQGLTGQLRRCSELEPFTPKCIGNAMLGLQNLSSDFDQVLELIACMTPRIEACHVELSPQNISNLLYGLKNMSSSSVQIQELLVVLIPKIQTSTSSFTAQGVSSSLFGLQKMSSSDPYVIPLVASLLPKIAASSDQFTALHTANSLFGLQNMKSDENIICDLLSLLSVKVNGCTEELTPAMIGMSLYGFVNMTGSTIEVRELLTAVLGKVRAYGAKNTVCYPLYPHEVSMAVYGLRNISTNESGAAVMVKAVIEVSRLIRMMPSGFRRIDPTIVRAGKSLPRHLSPSSYIFSSECMSELMCGLANSSSDHIEVRVLLRQLTEILGKTKDVFTGKQLASCFSGMMNMTNTHSEVVEMIDSLYLKVEELVETPNRQSLNAVDISRMMYGLKNMYSTIPIYVEMKTGEHGGKFTQSHTDTAAAASRRRHRAEKSVVMLLNFLQKELVMLQPLLLPHELSMCFCGLQNMSNDKAEVNAIISTLSSRLQLPMLSFSGQNISHLLIGLKRMTNDNDEMRQLLLLLASKLQKYKIKLNAEQFTMCLFSLQCMSDKHGDEVLYLIDTLVTEFMLSNKLLTPNQLVRCLFGLRNMTVATEGLTADAPLTSTIVMDTIRLLAPFASVGKQQRLTSSSPSLSPEEIQLCQEVTYWLSGGTHAHNITSALGLRPDITKLLNDLAVLMN